MIKFKSMLEIINNILGLIPLLFIIIALIYASIKYKQKNITVDVVTGTRCYCCNKIVDRGRDFHIVNGFHFRRCIKCNLMLKTLSLVNIKYKLYKYILYFKLYVYQIKFSKILKISLILIYSFLMTIYFMIFITTGNKIYTLSIIYNILLTLYWIYIIIEINISYKKDSTLM